MLNNEWTLSISELYQYKVVPYLLCNRWDLMAVLTQNSMVSFDREDQANMRRRQHLGSTGGHSTKSGPAGNLQNSPYGYLLQPIRHERRKAASTNGSGNRGTSTRMSIKMMSSQSNSKNVLFYKSGDRYTEVRTRYTPIPCYSTYIHKD